MSPAFSRRQLLRSAGGGAVGVAAFTMVGCTSSSTASGGGATTSAAPASLTFNGAGWSHDDTNDVYYQLGTSYVARPSSDFETLGVYVPGAYLNATKNSDGTYTATVNASGKVGSLTAATAPIVFPVNTPGYSAQNPPSSYSYDDVSAYLKEGFVYVAPGLRGKNSNSDTYTGNAPWGVTDLKAAVRYVRYNTTLIPGDKDAMFVFGHSGGGAQSAVMGSSGDSALYTPYLDAIGAATVDANGTALSDAIAGAMCWCPITNLDFANASYEWNMGQFASTGTRADGTWTKAYSADLAAAFGGYINGLGLTDASGQTLTLSTSPTGTYLSGSYYDHVVSVLQTSLNDFLTDTTFPYAPSTTTMAGMGGAPGGSGAAPGGTGPGGPGGMAGGVPSGMPTDGSMPGGQATGLPTGGAMPGGQASGGAMPGGQSTEAATTYDTVGSYIAFLNSTSTWVAYDASANTAKVLSLEGFVTSQKPASKDVGAFDAPDRSATENAVLGLNTAGLHFAQVSKDVIEANEETYATLANWKTDYASTQYTSDFARTDTVGSTVLDRVDMYNPLYYLSGFYTGVGSSSVAPHWRIRTGIMQGDTANTTEINLALALANRGIADVDFATVWGQGHTMAERTGDGATNFISWVKQTVG